MTTRHDALDGPATKSAISLAERFLRVVTICSFIAAGNAFAGPLEINQACATGPEGCFPGDLPGFPVEIEHDGSYVFTSDLQVSDPQVSGIVMPGSAGLRVTIDFAGHELRGGVTCSGEPPTISCDGGNATGMAVFGSSVVIRDGAISGFAGIAINARDAHVSGMAIHDNRAAGVVRILGGGILRDSLIERNMFDAMSVNGGIISRVVARANNRDGIKANRSIVDRSSAIDNGGAGATAFSDAVMHGLHSTGNQTGVELLDGRLLLLDGSIRGNAEAGLHATGTFAGASIQSSTVGSNGQYGLLVESPNSSSFSYYELTVNGHTTANLPASGFLYNLGRNACDGVACP